MYCGWRPIQRVFRLKRRKRALIGREQTTGSAGGSDLSKKCGFTFSFVVTREGRLYDKIGGKAKGKIVFVTDGGVICKVISDGKDKPVMIEEDKVNDGKEKESMFQ